MIGPRRSPGPRPVPRLVRNKPFSSERVLALFPPFSLAGTSGGKMTCPIIWTGAGSGRIGRSMDERLSARSTPPEGRCGQGCPEDRGLQSSSLAIQQAWPARPMGPRSALDGAAIISALLPGRAGSSWDPENTLMVMIAGGRCNSEDQRRSGHGPTLPPGAKCASRRSAIRPRTTVQISGWPIA